MNRKSWLTAAVILVLGASGLLLEGCTAPKPEAAAAPKTVGTLTAQSVTVPEAFHYIGVVDADAVVALSFKSGGTLMQLAVRAGDAVRKGDLLARLDAEDTRLYAASASAQQAAQATAVQKAEAALAYARKQWTRIDALHQAQAVSDSEAEEARLELTLREQEAAAARQALAQSGAQAGLARNALTDTQLMSPVDGFVAATGFDAGELVPAGVPVVTVRTRQQLVRFGVSQKDLPRLTLGMTARIDVDGAQAGGTVTSIGQLPDPQTRTYPVEVTVDGGSFPLGAVARVSLQGPPRTGVLIPIEALQISDSPFVYGVEEGLAVRKDVTPLETVGPQVFVSGLEAGDTVIVEGMKRVHPGDPVAVKGAD